MVKSFTAVALASVFAVLGSACDECSKHNPGKGGDSRPVRRPRMVLEEVLTINLNELNENGFASLNREGL